MERKKFREIVAVRSSWKGFVWKTGYMDIKPLVFIWSPLERTVVHCYCHSHCSPLPRHCVVPPNALYAINYTLLYCIRIRTRGGMYGQIYPSAWTSSRGQSLRELLKAEGYIWPYILSRVLIRTLYHVNNH